MFNLKWVLLDSIKDCKNLRIFRQIHAQLVTSGLVYDDFVTSKVMEFFANFVEYGDYACDYLEQGNTRLGSFPFNSLINGYVGGEFPQMAVSVYRRMVRDGFVPDMFTFPVLLKACSNFSGSREGRQVHGVVVKLGLLADHYVQNSLIRCYGACGDFSCAGKVFDEMLVRDVVSWNSLISGFMKAGHFDEAISVFFRMDVEPSMTTLVSVLAACARNGDLCTGKGIHGVIERRFKRWSNVTRLRRLMKDRGVRKAPGSSVIEVDGKAHEFVVGDISHLQTEEIYKVLNLINSVYHESH
ncbi:hypothetical protein Csa_019194 [Cucumis sativus]|nr:hypothetical protein Csa_019194 [Cucumis sativus]